MQLREEHDYFNKQFKLMSSMLQDMQNKVEYFYNKHTQQLDKLEQKIGHNSTATTNLNSSLQYDGLMGGDSSMMSSSDYYSEEVSSNGGGNGVQDEDR